MIQLSSKRSVSLPERLGISSQVFLHHRAMALMELLAQSPKIMLTQLLPLQVNMEDLGLKTSTSLAITILVNLGILHTIHTAKDSVSLHNLTVQLAQRRYRSKLKKSQKRRKRKRESLRRRIQTLMKIPPIRTHQTPLRLKTVRLIRKRSLKLEVYLQLLKLLGRLRVVLYLLSRSQLKTYLR